MWLSSKLRQLAVVLRPGVVTLKYPAVPRAAPPEFRGPPLWDHHKCVGCGGCAAHCPARTILVRDLCQDLRVMVYDGSRCTYCGRCADLCPEKAIAMSDQFELATDDRNDLTVSLELFMLTCQRCGRCYNLETRNVLDRMDLKGFHYDNLAMRAVLPRATERFDPRMLEESDRYQRPPQEGEK